MEARSQQQEHLIHEARIKLLRDSEAISPALVDAMNKLACALQETDRLRCLAILTEAISLAMLIQYAVGEARARYRYGWLSLLDGQMDTALQNSIRADNLAVAVNDSQVRCGALYVSASVHQRINNIPFALRDWFKLLHIALLAGDLQYEADAYNELGILYRGQNEHEEALDCFKQALKRYVALGDPRDVAALNNIAHVYARMNDGVQALVYARMALDKCPQDLPRWRATLLETMGRACLANGNTRLSLAQFESGIKLYQMARVTGQVNADSVIATLYQSAALALRKLGQFDQAAHKLDLALTEAERASDHPLQVEIHTDLASLMSLLGAKEMAQHHQARASALGHRLEHEQTVLRERVMDVFRAERNALPLAIGLAA
jgi:tetratricopeptide (TPR) repeat protein